MWWEREHTWRRGAELHSAVTDESTSKALDKGEYLVYAVNVTDVNWNAATTSTKEPLAEHDDPISPGNSSPALQELSPAR